MTTVTGMTHPGRLSSALGAVHPRDLVRPRLRGVLHQYACAVAIAIGCILVSQAENERARLAASVYAVSLAALFGVSAAYHRITWRPSLRAWVARIDHSMIFVFIAGTYTPFALLVLRGTTAIVVLAVVWTGAALGVGSRLLWHRAPRWVTVPLYIGLGWVAAFIVPQLIGGAGIAVFVLLCVGGVAYTIGGVMYALRRPDPAPNTFGYHEVFHLMTVIAAICHYVAVSFVVYQFS
jgi:hemolysin III